LGLDPLVARESQGGNYHFLADSKSVPTPATGELLAYDLDGGDVGRRSDPSALGYANVANSLMLTSRLAKSMLPLRRVIDATRLAIAFAKGLRAQLVHPREPALPLVTWAAAEQIEEINRKPFCTELERIENLDRKVLEWYLSTFSTVAAGNTLEFALP